MIQIGKGSGRKVYDLGDGFVFKEPYSETGFQQNETELFIYEDANDYIKMYLCPTKKDINGNKMIKAELVTEEEFEKCIINIKKYQDIIIYLQNEYGLNDDIESSKNWGKLNDQYVLIDYGYTKELFNKIMWRYTGDFKYLT